MASQRLSLRDAYLGAYNGVQFVAWGLVLVHAVQALLQQGVGLGGVFRATKVDVSIAQALTVLETLHSLVGLVRSPVSANLMQFAGRSHCLLATTLLPQLHGTVASALLVLTWSVSDVVRYAWAFSGCVFIKPPRLLTYLRYTLFMVLYPLGAMAEWALLYAALPAARDGFGKVLLPNTWNFGFDYHTFLLIVLACYGPLFLQLYSHMLRQRGKKLKAE
jgi:very-long-chain (3R)-3-hydroxyacyl-CoA dehydratase